MLSKYLNIYLKNNEPFEKHSQFNMNVAILFHLFKFFKKYLIFNVINYFFCFRNILHRLY